ncbi:NYN domain-containing protein [Corynebacterium kroppenstedtii]|uniref:NYN domain-containing protein n=1 Tax=Corynebacterium sp. PCR 32 TaxID=3351342 RepID=UPI0030A45ACD
MLERTLVFVDTSYLLASFYNSWEEGARTQLEIDLPEVCSVLDRMITQHVGQPVQRQNWYDGIPDSGPHRYQRALRTVDGVQLRAGLLIETGQRRTQKAVDTRLVADMILAAVRQQCSDIVLVSGDQDMIPGVVEASALGIRVHLYGFSWDSMSNALRHKCDSITVLDPREDFADTMQIQPLEGPIPPSIPPRPLDTDDLISTTITTEHTPDDTTETNTNDDTWTSRRIRRHTNDATAEPPTDPHQSTTTPSHPPRPTPNAIITTPRRSTNTTAHQLIPEHTEHSPTGGPPTTHSPEPSADTHPSTTPTDTINNALTTNDNSTTEPTDDDTTPPKTEPKPAPKPSMMAPRRKLRSRYVPLPNEIWTTTGFQTPFDVGQQYATWWFNHVATEEQRDSAHVLSGGGLPPNVDRPLLQFACESLHEYTLSESQRVSLRDGFHTGIRAILITGDD